VTYAKIQNVSATDRLLGRSTAGAGVVEEIVCTAFGRSLIDDADASTARTTLGLAIGTDVLAPTGNGSGLTDLNASNLASGTVALARLPDGARTRPYTWGVAGTPTTGPKSPHQYVEAAGTAYLIVLGVESGTFTVDIERSTNDGSSWSVLESHTLASGRSATKSVSQSLAAGDLLRVNYTAVGSAVDPHVTLHVRKT
jgi:hypothetical protein